MTDFSASDTTYDGYPAVLLEARPTGLTATFCPSLGMIGCSLTHDGAELLGQRGGLRRYAEAGSTMGIPLLHPWANRLSAFEYVADGEQVTLDRESPLIRIDGPTGLPIHGLLAASPHWGDVTTRADADRAELSARFDFGTTHPELLAMFPFPHTLDQSAALDDTGLTIETSLTPTGEEDVPVSFGFHPYLRLPNVARTEWNVSLPVTRRLVLNAQQVPTGDTEPVEIPPGPLGDETFDDGFCDLETPTVFALEGGGRRIELEFLSGYAFAQVYAPAEHEVLCFEPMTSATNALVTGGPWLRRVRPGDTYRASFQVRVVT